MESPQPYHKQRYDERDAEKKQQRTTNARIDVPDSLPA